MAMRGIRGATTVDADNAAMIQEATRELLEQILESNGIRDFGDVVSAIFTTTDDVSAAFPAEAARALGMNKVPLLCAREIPVPGSMPRCVRVLLHVNSNRTQEEIVHVYLRDAKKLRPDMDSAQ